MQIEYATGDIQAAIRTFKSSRRALTERVGWTALVVDGRFKGADAVLVEVMLPDRPILYFFSPYTWTDDRLQLEGPYLVDQKEHVRPLDEVEAAEFAEGQQVHVALVELPLEASKSSGVASGAFRWFRSLWSK